MRNPTPWLCRWMWVPMLAACGGEGGADPENGVLQDQGAVLCLENEITGQGNVWRGTDPATLELRDLPCMTGDPHLRGTYVPSLTPSQGEAAESADLRFVYEAGDPRLYQVEAYYVVTHMASWVISRLDAPDAHPGVLQRVRSDELHLDYDRAEVESQQLCYELHIGMQRMERQGLNLDVFAHEFGHHLLFSLNRDIGNSMLHEGVADYLAAAFTRDSMVEPSEWPGFDRDLDNDFAAPADLMSRGEYCQHMLDAIEAGGVASVYPGLVDQFTWCLQGDPDTLAAPEPHWSGMILGGALWELRGMLGEDTFQPVLVKALTAAPIEGTGDLLQQLLAADEQLWQGADQEAIEEVFTRRGIAQNLAGFPRISYPDCP